MATVSRSNQTAKVLQIALIISVTLLFILAVLVYFVFSSRNDALAQLAESQQQLSDSQRERTQQQNAANELKRILGFPEGKPIEEINTETTQAFGQTFSDFQADANNYTALANLLLEELRRKDDALLKASSDLQAAVREREAAKQQAADAKAAADRDLQQREQQFVSRENDYNQRRTAFEAQQQQLRDAQQKAQDESTRYQDVMKTLADGEKLIAADVRERYREAATDPSAQVRVLFEQLNSQADEIAKKNRLVAALGASSRDVQEYLLRSLPQADRVDQYDGRVVAIDNVNQTVQIAAPAAAGLRPGLVFRVFAGRDQTPLWSDSKGLVEVISASGGNVLARIRSESVRNPIIEGDGVATPLWSPGMPMDVVIVGLVRLDDDNEEDSAALTSMIERLGGRVSENVEASTTIVVDGGRPVSRGGETRGPEFRPQDERRRTSELEQAKRFGIRTVGLDTFLDWLGVDRETRQSGQAIDIPGSRVTREDTASSTAP